MKFRVGIDLDNTIINYDRLFTQIAKDCGFVIPKNSISKRKVRDAVRSLPDGERKWQQLQKAVYRDRIGEARIFRGAGLCLKRLIWSGNQILIISHKAPEFCSAALNFIRSRLPYICDKSIFFESTRQKKISKIQSLECDYMIDDLEEVFTDASFPEKVKKIHFDPSGKSEKLPEIVQLKSWEEIGNYLLKEFK